LGGDGSGDEFRDRFEIERRLREDGYVRDFVALDRKSGARVRLRVIGPPGFAYYEALAQALATAAPLRHRSIAIIPEVIRTGHYIVLAGPYVEGETLQRRLETEGQSDIGWTVRVAGQVAEAVAYAHASGVLHGDLCPEVILLHDEGVQVSEFGWALASQSVPDGGILAGHLAYMAPERLRSGRSIDVRADVYSLGAVVYHALGGQPPFGADGGTFAAHDERRRATPLRQLRAEIPNKVEAAVLRALAPKPAGRFSSVEGFAAALAVSRLK
jgi:serine/threonine-protein kinase